MTARRQIKPCPHALADVLVCRDCATRRRLQNAWKAKHRARKLAAAQATATACPKRWGRFGRCGAVLEHTVVDGRLVTSCPRCARTARGLCVDCPAPVAGVVGKARRCRPCRKAANLVSAAKHKRNHPERVARSVRQYLARPEVKAARAAYRKVLFYAQHGTAAAPKRPHRTRATPAQRNAYAKAQRAGVVSRPAPRADGYRLCIGTAAGVPCDRVVTGHKKKCSHCKRRDAEAARALLAHGGLARPTYATGAVA